jgi:hypothetical protein
MASRGSSKPRGMLVPPNKRMKLTSLSTAPGQMEAPSRAPHGGMEGRTGSQLIRGVRPT